MHRDRHTNCCCVSQVNGEEAGRLSKVNMLPDGKRLLGSTFPCVPLSCPAPVAQPSCHIPTVHPTQLVSTATNLRPYHQIFLTFSDSQHFAHPVSISFVLNSSPHVCGCFLIWVHSSFPISFCTGLSLFTFSQACVPTTTQPLALANN